MAHIYNSQLDAYTLYHKQHEEQSTSSLGPALPALGHALAGSTGTAISNLCIYPLDLIITRLQVQRQLRNSSTEPHEGEYKGVIDAAQKIYENEGGIAAFYTGIVQDTGKSIADSFLFFLFYNYLRQNRLQKHGIRTTTLPVFDELSVGVLAGACSKFFTTPISNIVTRKQTASMISARSSSSRAEPSVNDIVNQIRSEKGLQGFWSGYSASLVLTLNPSITFFLYETFKRTLLPRSSRDEPGARLTFLMAAVSKAIASTITYPFSLAKARAQVGSKPPVNRDDASKIKSEVSAATSTSHEATLREREAEAKKAGKDVKRTAARSTVFNTILSIYRTEGAQALYEGIWGEILKGFFSHGITMLVKEAIHKLIIQLYFSILRALKKFPTPSEAMGQAQDLASTSYDKAQEIAGTVNDKAQGAVTRGGELASNVYDKAAGSVSGAYSTAATTVESVKEVAKDQLVGAKDAAKSQLSNNTPTAKGNTTAGLTGDAYERAQSEAYKAHTNANDSGKTGLASTDLRAKEAGNLLGNAREQVGRGVRGEKGEKE